MQHVVIVLFGKLENYGSKIIEMPCFVSLQTYANTDTDIGQTRYGTRSQWYAGVCQCVEYAFIDAD